MTASDLTAARAYLGKRRRLSRKHRAEAQATGPVEEAAAADLRLNV